jgi:hypothetical protein
MIDRFVYTLVVVLALIVLGLLLLAPADLMSTRVVYQGF